MISAENFLTGLNPKVLKHLHCSFLDRGNNFGWADCRESSRDCIWNSLCTRHFRWVASHSSTVANRAIKRNFRDDLVVHFPIIPLIVSISITVMIKSIVDISFVNSYLDTPKTNVRNINILCSRSSVDRALQSSTCSTRPQKYFEATMMFSLFSLPETLHSGSLTLPKL